MESCAIHRPQEAAIRRILEKHPRDAAGMVVRLAWLAGLRRGEILTLDWEDVDFLNQELVLADRSVPLCPELEEYLAQRSEEADWDSSRVVLSDRLHRPMQPQPLSHLVRRVLDEEGQTEVRLIDLRHDFILRQLLEHDWQYVSRITGTDAATLDQRFAPFLPAGRVSTRIPPGETEELDVLRLEKLLDEEGISPAGAALRLTWQAGLSLERTAALTWAQADFRRGVFRLEGGKETRMDSRLAVFLGKLWAETEDAAPGDTVIRSPRSRTPMRPERLSRVVRASLIRGGLDNLTLRDLRRDYELRAGGEVRILQAAEERGFVTRGDAAELLHLTAAAAYHHLARLTKQGRLIRVGIRYYPPGAVVPPEEQYPAIRAYLLEEGAAYRQDIARLLHVAPQQCTVILKRLVEEGKLRQEKYRYTLREP